MNFTIDKKRGHVVVVHLQGRLIGDFQVYQLNDQIDHLIELNYKHFVVDLAQLEYINSTGLNFFLKLLTKVRRFDGEVVLCCLNEALHNLLVTTKLTAFFTIKELLEHALAHVKEEKSAL